MGGTIEYLGLQPPFYPLVIAPADDFLPKSVISLGVFFFFFWNVCLFLRGNTRTLEGHKERETKGSKALSADSREPNVGWSFNHEL